MAASNGRGAIAPVSFPPPVDSQREFIKRTLDPEEDRIEVGVAIVGGGTAGLACATRLLQLLADDPETMERLGEVPVAVIEKAKTCGGHNLSGAVMRPGPLQELFPDLSREEWRAAGFAFGEVRKEAVYMLPSAKAKVRIPTPPPFKNHGAEVISVAALCRYMAARAEEAGAYVLTETAASRLLVDGGRVVVETTLEVRDGKIVRQVDMVARNAWPDREEETGRGPPRRKIVLLTRPGADTAAVGRLLRSKQATEKEDSR